MGAFGRDLIRVFGGNLAAYDNAGVSKRKELTKAEKLQEELEKDERTLEALSKSAESILERAENMYSLIKDDVTMSQQFSSKKVFNKFLKWREEFLKKMAKNGK